MSGAVSTMSNSYDDLYEESIPAALNAPLPVVPGTAQGDEAFKEVVLRHRASKRFKLVPEVDNDPFLHAVEGGGGRLGPREYQLLGNDRIRALMSCAIYAWSPTDEQVLASFAVAEASGLMEFDLGEGITPAHLAVAALAPGTEDSTLVRSLSSPLRSLTAGELGNWVVAVRRRVIEVMAVELRRYGRADLSMGTLPRDDRTLSMRIESMMTLSDADWLRRRFLHRVGKQFLHQVSSSNFHDMDLIMAVNGDGDIGEEDRLGAERLLSLFPGENPFRELSVDDFLPLGFLLALPTFKVKRLGEFHALVEEYNVEWAVASYDWSGGEASTAA